jgi:C4-type Zn-finger protein
MSKIEIFLLKGEFGSCPLCGSSDYIEVAYIVNLPYRGKHYFRRCIFCGEITGAGRYSEDTQQKFSKLQMTHVKVDTIVVLGGE